MNRSRTNFAVDLVLFVSILIVFVTGFILWGWTRPAGAGGPRSTPHGQAAASPQGGHADAPKGRAQILWGLTEASEDGTFWGMTKNGGWKQTHCWVGVTVLLLFLIIHLAMHWDWISGMCCCRCQRQQEEQKKLQE